MSEPDKDLERRRAQQRLVNAYHRVFGTADGKTVLADLEASFGFRARVFNPTSKGNHHGYDTIQAALTDGARATIIHIHDKLFQQSRGDDNIQQTTTIKKP